jgi:hypothetical protein
MPTMALVIMLFLPIVQGPGFDSMPAITSKRPTKIKIPMHLMESLK